MKAPRFTFVSRLAVCVVLCGGLGACDRANPPDKTAAAPKADAPAAASQPARSARFVKLEEVTEWTGKPWAVIAELNLLDATGSPIDRAQWTAVADSAGTSELPKYAIDGDPKSHWHTRWEGPEGSSPPPPHWIVVGLGRTMKIAGFRYLPRQDGNANGAIAQYRFYVSDDGVTWGEPVSTGNFADMGAATAEKTVFFAAVTANHPPVAESLPSQTAAMGQSVSVQVVANDSDGDVLAYSSAGLPPGLTISAATGTITGTPIVPGNYTASIGITDGKGPATTVSSSWTVAAPGADTAGKPAAQGEVRFVKLEALSEISGKPFTAMAEFNLIGADGRNLPRNAWTASADSSDVSDGPANAIDGVPATHWHTRWSGDAPPPPPHTFIIDMKHATTVKGFKYLPRQDGSVNGVIGRFRFYTSVDGVDWGKPVVEGDFTGMGPTTAEKTVELK